MNTEMKYLETSFEVKKLDKNGVFEGYGSVFGVEDFGSDIVVKGAFLRSLEELKSKGKKIPILWQHSSKHPLGVYEEVKEDEHGLFVRGRLLVDDVAKAKEAYALMKVGAVTGLSIGYSVKKYEIDEDNNVRKLTDVDLLEISSVTFPMNDDARINAVKSKLNNGDLPSLKEFEGFLREAGFSKTEATAIASKGLSHLLRSESAQPQKANFIEALSSFSL